MPSLPVTLYRGLLRVATLYDAHPHLKAFLRMPPAYFADAGLDKPSEQSKLLTTQFTADYFDGYRFYMASGKSLVTEVQRAFVAAQNQPELEPAFLEFGMDMLSRLQSTFSVAGEAAREYGQQPALPSLDEMKTEIRLMGPGAALEPGALLVEHPALTGPGRGLHLFSGGTRQSLSTVCINRPVPATVGSVWEMPDPLGDNPLFIGGVDETTSLFVLHPYGDLPGSTPFLDNLFIGCNINEAAEKVGEGEAERQDFKFVAGCNKYASASDIPPHYFLASGPGVPLVALLPSLNASHDDGSEGAFGAMLHSAATWSHVMRGFGGEHEVFADVSWHIMASFNLSIGKVVEVDDAHAEDPCAPASVHMAEEEAEGADSDDSDSSDSDSSSSDSSDSESSDSESSDSDSDAGSR